VEQEAKRKEEAAAMIRRSSGQLFADKLFNKDTMKKLQLTMEQKITGNLNKTILKAVDGNATIIKLGEWYEEEMGEAVNADAASGSSESGSGSDSDDSESEASSDSEVEEKVVRKKQESVLKSPKSSSKSSDEESDEKEASKEELVQMPSIDSNGTMQRDGSVDTSSKEDSLEKKSSNKCLTAENGSNELLENTFDISQSKLSKKQSVPSTGTLSIQSKKNTKASIDDKQNKISIIEEKYSDDMGSEQPKKEKKDKKEKKAKKDKKNDLSYQRRGSHVSKASKIE